MKIKWWEPEESDIISGKFISFCNAAGGLGVILADKNGEEIHVGCGITLRNKLAVVRGQLKVGESLLEIQFNGKQQVKSDSAKTVALYSLWLNDSEIFSEKDFGRPLSADEVLKAFTQVEKELE